MMRADPTIRDRAVRDRLARAVELHGRRAPGALFSTALRTRGRGLRDLAAHLASRGTATYAELAHDLDAGVPLGLEPQWAVTLARVAALQDDGPTEHARALQLFELAGEAGDVPETWLLVGTLLASLGRPAELLRYLDDRPGTPHADLLRLDALNPFTGSTTADEAEWRAGFAGVFAGHGLAPVDVGDGDGSPFDRMTSRLRPATVSGPLVSVVMTTYRPGPELDASVRSILRQTWADLELIVVDDASGPEYAAHLDEVEALDVRVRVIRLQENGGTYLARNAAIAAAAGRYVTGQDDDDWAHPQRLELQMAPVLGDGAASTMALALRATPDLRVTKPGARLIATHQPTFLAERDLVRELGGYLPARKGADRELVERVSRSTGSVTHIVDRPLSVYRLTPSSLSRAEFGPGWAHTSRLAFWALADRAHDRAVATGAPLSSVVTGVSVPLRFAVTPATPVLDLVVVDDFLGSRGVEHPGVGALRALVGAGLRVGVCHVEDARRFRRGNATWDEDVLDLVNAGTVALVALDDDAQVTTVVVADAGILQTPPPTPARWQVRDVALLDAFDGSSGVDEATRSAPECDAHARWLFGVEPRWTARTPEVRRWLQAEIPMAELDEDVLPHPIVVADRHRRVPRGDRIIGGVMSQVDPVVIAQLARAARSGWDVRLLAPAEVVAAARGQRPALTSAVHAWIDEVAVAEFVVGLDFVVAAPVRDHVGHVAEMEALAAGVVPVIGSPPESWPTGLGLSLKQAGVCTADTYVRQSAAALRYASSLSPDGNLAAWAVRRVRAPAVAD